MVSLESSFLMIYKIFIVEEVSVTSRLHSRIVYPYRSIFERILNCK